MKRSPAARWKTRNVSMGSNSSIGLLAARIGSLTSKTITNSKSMKGSRYYYKARILVCLRKHAEVITNS